MSERIEQLVIQAAGGLLSYHAEGDWYLSEKEVKKFAELIRADEREACAKLCEEWGDSLERQWQNDEINERIDQLVIKAAGGPLSYDDEGDWYLSEKEVKKFAELIVKECADYVACGEFGDAGLAEELKKHFGVG